MKEYIIAVDRGSTNVKAVVFNTRGEEILVSVCASPKPVSLRPDWWEQDMDEIWESAAKAIRGVFAEEIRPEDILGVIVTGQGNGLMPIDKDGNPAGKGILSTDSRAAEIVSGWQADGRYEQALRTVHLPFAAGSPLPLAAWFHTNDPAVFEAMDKLLFSKDWVRYKLCGTVCTDPSDASGAGLMDLCKSTYAYDVFDLLGVGCIRDKLPEIRPSHQVAGSVTKEAAARTGLLAGTPVFCGAHDIAAYPFGIGSADPKQLVCAAGTWGMNLLPAKSLDGLPAALYHSVPGYYLTGVGDGNSGGCLDNMLGTLCGEEKRLAAAQGRSLYDYIEDGLLDREPTGILFHPFLFGSDVGASFYGIKNWHSKTDILRAVYEGIVMGHCANIRAIPGHGAVDFIWLIGGASKSAVVGQLFADITGFPVKVPAVREVTARGGALNALVGLGICKDHAEAAIPVSVRAEYLPNPDMQEFYARKFAIFEELMQVNSGIWTKLSCLCRA